MNRRQKLCADYVRFCDCLPDKVWRQYSKLPRWFHRHTYGRAENYSLNKQFKPWTQEEESPNYNV